MNKGIKSTKFWFSRSKFFFLRNVGFRLAQRIVFEIDCKNLILLVFWCRMPNYFLVDFALVSFIDFLTCVWFHHFSLLIWFVFQLSLYGKQRKNSLYYYWTVTNSLAGYFTRIFPNSLHYIWTFLSYFVGVFLKIFYTILLLLESFKLFVRVFH